MDWLLPWRYAVNRRLRASLGTGIVIVTMLTGACGNFEGEDPRSEFAATGAPSPTVTPIAAPAQWRSVKGPNFSISVPPSFRETTSRASNETDMYFFDAPRSTKTDTDVVRIAVMRDEKPASDALQQSYLLEDMQSVKNKSQVRRSEIEWPGAETAFLVQWFQPVAGSDGVRRDNWQLMAQVNPELILNVIAVAPEGTLEEHNLDEIFATFKVLP